MEKPGHADFHLLIGIVSEHVGHTDGKKAHIDGFLSQVSAGVVLVDGPDEQGTLGGAGLDDPTNDSKSGIQGEFLPLPDGGEHLGDIAQALCIQVIFVSDRDRQVGQIKIRIRFHLSEVGRHLSRLALRPDRAIILRLLGDEMLQIDEFYHII